MKCALVSAATINHVSAVEDLCRDEKERVPLGVLCLASLLESEGRETVVVDLDRLFLARLAGSDGGFDARGFPASVAATLAEADAGFYGFSSICSSYPLTLRIATALSRLRPEAYIVLGGPQATATAEETVAAFPAVDAVVCGEGEPVVPALVGALADGGDLRAVPGLVFRGPGEIVRTTAAPLLTDLDALPTPAFDALPHVREYETLPVEAGRGCPFSCTFCSTSRFFRRSFRTKSVRRLVEQIGRLNARYGVADFDLVQDNLTVNRAWVVEFCESLRATGAGISWSCSARTDCVDDELLDLMRRAGCRGIFFGVESGSERIQKVIGKKLDLDAARARIRHASRRGIDTAVGLMAGFPEETMEDLARTVRLFVEVLRHDCSEPQLSLLSPLAGTPIHLQHRHRLVLDGVISDIALPAPEGLVEDLDLVAAHPGIFSSYYAIPTPSIERRLLDELRVFLLGFTSELRWLLVALDRTTGDTLALFSSWRAWRVARGGASRRGDLPGYYGGAAFRADLLAFVREEVIPRHPEVAHVLRALAGYLDGPEATGRPRHGSAARKQRHGDPKDAGDVPVRAPGCHAIKLQADLARIVRHLRRGWRLTGIAPRETTVVTRECDGRIEIVQLSPVSAELFHLCDGQRDVRAVADAFGGAARIVEGVRGDAACRVGLEFLRRAGLIRMVHPHDATPGVAAR